MYISSRDTFDQQILPSRHATFREYLLSLQCSGIHRKVVFVLKMYDLMETNVDLLENSINHKAMFLEYCKNIPQISVLKIFQGYPRNIFRL